MRTVPMTVIPTAALFLFALPLGAHHSYAPYDLDRTVTLDGVVTKFLWANPHVYIDVQTEDDGNEALTWTVESLSPVNMRNFGWSASALAAGDRVTVTVHPARDPERKIAFGQSVLKTDGTLLSMPNLRDRTPPTADPTTAFAAADLSGKWQVRWDLGVVSQFIPPLALSLTEKGAAAVESFDANLDIPGRDCMPFTVPYIMLFAGLVNIELGEDVTVIRAAEVERTVHMKLDAHDGAPFDGQGHSIGRWEDSVLVVDTTSFTDHRSGNAWGLPSGSQKHLIERFALSADRTRLDYTFTLEDPEYMAAPVTATLMLRHRPDLPFVTMPCDLESARRYLDFIKR
jgi:hypothetical protein